MKQSIGAACCGLLIAWAALPSAVQAESTADKCIRYANTAVHQYQEAQKNKCGFKGSLWSNTTSYHYNWCIRGNNPNVALSQIKARAQMLAKCKSTTTQGAQGSVANKCVNYANTAVQQYQQMINKKCGFKGPRWSNSTSYHYNWCIRGNNPNVAPSETKARAQMLATCKS